MIYNGNGIHIRFVLVGVVENCENAKNASRAHENDQMIKRFRCIDVTRCGQQMEILHRNASEW